ncbi:RNA-binding protein [Anaeramoeba flamelloides]|uniref:RNA-binding protein n=1 Tax=Anaeramoeba flamelloides TaxID=1746091 RepID=A0AAV7ZBQ3_9EUKA|nr:RNA-binding protein [Anaeramoeba flamelloides]
MTTEPNSTDDKTEPNNFISGGKQKRVRTNFSNDQTNNQETQMNKNKQERNFNYKQNQPFRNESNHSFQDQGNERKRNFNEQVSDYQSFNPNFENDSQNLNEGYQKNKKILGRGRGRGRGRERRRSRGRGWGRGRGRGRGWGRGRRGGGRGRNNGMWRGSNQNMEFGMNMDGQMESFGDEMDFPMENKGSNFMNVPNEQQPEFPRNSQFNKPQFPPKNKNIPFQSFEQQPFNEFNQREKGFYPPNNKNNELQQQKQQQQPYFIQQNINKLNEDLKIQPLPKQNSTFNSDPNYEQQNPNLNLQQQLQQQQKELQLQLQQKQQQQLEQELPLQETNNLNSKNFITNDMTNTPTINKSFNNTNIDNNENNNPNSYDESQLKLYVGNLPSSTDPKILLDFLNNEMYERGMFIDQNVAIGVSIDRERNFGFVHFSNEELTTRALKLDRIIFGRNNLKIGRPTSYKQKRFKQDRLVNGK